MAARVQSETLDASPLGERLNFEFSGRAAPNRFLKAAMSEKLSSWDLKNPEARGIPSKELQNLYKRWGEGGFGHILTGNVMLAYDQLEGPGNAIIPPDAPFKGPRFEAFRTLASLAKANGSLITAQVSHPGRQAEVRIQPDPLSASDVQLEKETFGMRFAKPHAASLAEIQEVVNMFAHAAVYLHKAGFDGIEIHGAHGYLLAQFLAQSTNKRTDQYGGSIENRARIILEIAHAIRQKVPASTGFILGIKLNSVEFQTGGFTSDEAKAVCRLLEENEFDFVELTGGTYEALAFVHRESTRQRESYFLDFAETIVPELKKTKAYITGGFRSVGGMVNALKTVDGIGLARAACQEPRLPRDLLEGKVSGVIDQQVDQNEMILTNVIAGTQIKQIGNDQEPINMGLKDNVDAFVKDMGLWAQRLTEDAAEMNMYGFVDIETVQALPYGTVVA